MLKYLLIPPKAVLSQYRRIKRKIRENRLNNNPIKLSDDELVRLMGYESINDVLNIRQLSFHFNYIEKEEIIEELNNHPELVDICLKDADKICDHIFNLLGSGEKNLGPNIDWHRDFKTGYRWIPDKYYVDSLDYIDYLKDDADADVKIPWELSRFQHLVTLGKAYWFTEDKKYAEEFVKQIESWINNNPVEMGVNWSCTMDVAIRAINWIWGYHFFLESEILTDDFRIEFFKYLYLHGRFIMGHLEFADVRGNHYLSNIAGLIYIGLFFKDSAEAQQWIEKGVSALIEEMNYQVFPDGVNTELSTNYHRLVTEIFISTTILCLKNDITLPKPFLNRLEKMFEYIISYTKPDGNAPIIGDNDDGRLQILTNYYGWNRQDHRYLISIGAEFFDRKDFADINPSNFNEEAFWLCGSLKNPSEIGKTKWPNSASFKDSGFYIMRHEDHYTFIDASSPDSKYFQGHRHNSALSFELFANDKSFIIDPGAYVYTSNRKMRNLFRSTSYHNTVEVDSQEQNTFKEELFDQGTEAKTKIIKWESTEKEDIFCGEHYGYRRLKDPVVHRREIIFNKNKRFWIINDNLSCKGKHKFDLNLHLAQMELENHQFHHSYITKSNGANIAIIPLETDDLTSQILDGCVSYSYGKKTKTPILRYSKSSDGPTSFSNLIIPFKNKDEIEKVVEEFQINI